MSRGLLWILLLMFASLYGCGDVKTKVFNKTVGCYALDLSRTTLGEYNVDSIRYSAIRLVFKADSTFQLNMHVPFLMDTAGVWIPSRGGMDDWSWLSYSVWKKEASPNNGNQFTRVYKDGKDSILYLNGASSKKGHTGIQKIYFRKISSSVSPCF